MVNGVLTQPRPRTETPALHRCTTPAFFRLACKKLACEKSYRADLPSFVSRWGCTNFKPNRCPFEITAERERFDFAAASVAEIPDLAQSRSCSSCSLVQI